MKIKKCKCGRTYEVPEYVKVERKTCGDYSCKVEETRRRARDSYQRFKQEHPERFNVTYEILCVLCKKPFKTKKILSKYCKDCKGKADASYSKKYYWTRTRVSKVVKVICLNCKDEFETARSNQLFCGKAECRAKAASYYSNRCMKKNREKQRILGKARSISNRHCDNEPCVVCGSNKHIHKHHHDYEKPKEVIPLCPKHHKAIHSWDSV